MRSDEFVAKIYEYNFTETLEDWSKAKALLKVASKGRVG
jgi:hypothetical protein